MRKVLGVNLTGQSMQASVIEGGLFGSPSVIYEGAVRLGPAAEADKVVSETLSELGREHSPDAVILGLPLERFTHFLVELPAMNRKMMRKALDFELEKYLPLPVDEYYFDFLPLPGEEGRTKALVLSIRRDIVTSVTKVFEAVGMRLTAVRCSTVTAFEGLAAISGEEKLSGLGVNVSDGTYEIAGLKDSSPSFLKWISPKDKQPVDEIARLSSIYAGPVYFVGNVPPGVSEKFNSRKFDFPLSRVLAQSGIRNTKSSMNFVPETGRNAGRDYYPFAIGGLMAATVLIYLLSGVWAYFRDWRALQKVEAKRLHLKQAASGFVEARRKLDALRDDRQALVDFSNNSDMAVRAVRDLTLALPSQSWLISFSVDERGKIEVEGFSTDTDAMVKSLEASKKFSNISFSAPLITRGGEKRFALKMEMVSP